MFLQPVSQRTKLLFNLKQIGTQRAQNRCKYEAKRVLKLNEYLFNAFKQYFHMFQCIFVSQPLLAWVGPCARSQQSPLAGLPTMHK